MNTNIDWNYPQPRSGFSGAMDKFIGPGATRPEIIIGMGASILAPLAVVIYAYLVQLGWDAVQYVIAGLLASDIVGGIAVDTTSSAKRWYHREGQGTRSISRKDSLIRASVVRKAERAWRVSLSGQRRLINFSRGWWPPSTTR